VLRESVLGMARSLGPGARLPTVAMLCDSLSVSNATLDSILRELEKQGAVRREHGRGIFVSPTIRLKTVGVVFGRDVFSPGASPFWGLMLRAVRDQAGDDGRFVAQAYLDITHADGGLGGHAQLVEDLEDRRLDGLLLLAPKNEYDEVAELRAHGVPLVVFGGQAAEGWSVTIDWTPLLDRAAAEIARSGCRRVGLIAPPDQQALFTQALRQAGAGDVRLDDWSYETWGAVISHSGAREHSAHQLACRRLAERPATPLPEVLVSLDDTMTRGVITALLQAGMQPGRDVRIVTAENKGSPVLAPYAAEITRVALDPAKIVKAALDMLETLMDGGTPPETPVRVKADGAEKVNGEW